jgi:type II secretory pathway pseudopilin PulG
MSPSLRKSFASNRSAFSLVEVVLAVGVIAFAFVAILGLIPAGLTQFRKAIDTSVGAQIAQRCIQDAEQTDFNTLVDYAHTQGQGSPGIPTYFRAPSMAATASAAASPNNPGACIRYFDEQGNEIIPAARSGTTGDPSPTEYANIVYYVNTRIAASTNLPRVTGSNAPISFDLATVTVQVVFNPGHFGLSVVQSTGLVDPSQTPRPVIQNYCAQVGRNF